MFGSYFEIIQSNLMVAISLITGISLGYATCLLKERSHRITQKKTHTHKWIEQFVDPVIIIDSHANVRYSNAAFRNIVDESKDMSSLSTLFPGFHYRQHQIIQGPVQLLDLHNKAWFILTDTLDAHQQLIRLVPTCHVSAQELIEESSTDQLQTLKEILTNLAHAIEQPLLSIIDAAQKIESIFNTDLPRSQFLSRSLDVDKSALQAYFERYSSQNTLCQLLSSIEQIQRLASEIKPQPTDTLQAGKTFSFKEAFNDAAVKINSTAAAQNLIENGIQPVIYMDELDYDIRFGGSKKIFVDSIVAIYELIVQPFDHKTHDSLPNVPSLSCNISLNHTTQQLIVKFYEISTYNWLAAYRKQYSPEKLSKSCQITLRGIIGLVRLYSTFQIAYATEYLTPSTSTLTLAFPINSLNKNLYNANKIKEGSEFSSQELLESLNEDIEKTLKNKKNITFH